MDGILIVDKPAGFTSFDVIAKLRGVLQTRKVGHSGTLDPAATGVLPLFFGHATKAISLLPNNQKRYTAEICFGVQTTTGDAEGEITATADAPMPARLDIEAAFSQFVGKITQVPPMVSAVKVGGKRLYQLAREGKEIARPAREIEIYELRLLDYTPERNTATVDVFCSRGTYIRTLAEDLAAALGTFAHLANLRRTFSNGFAIAQSHTLEEIQRAAANGQAAGLLAPVENAFLQLPVVVLNEKQQQRVLNGVKLEFGQDQHEPERVRVNGPNGFVAVGERSGATLKQVKQFI